MEEEIAGGAVVVILRVESAVLLGEELPVNEGAGLGVKVSSDSSEESPQAEASKSTTHAAQAITAPALVFRCS